MPPLLDQHGLRIAAFEPALAERLGADAGQDGCFVVVEAALQGRSRVECRDWLFCLARKPGSLVRRLLIDVVDQEPEAFILSIEEGFKKENNRGLPPARLTSDSVSSDVRTMLADAEARAANWGGTQIGEQALLSALLDAAGNKLTDLLRVWAEDHRFEKFIRELRPGRRASAPVALFDEAGQFNAGAFTESGWGVLSQALEDAASLGSARVTTRHLLYTLLSSAQSPLSVTLSSFGVDPQRELHAELVRELRRGTRRELPAAPHRNALFDSVVRVVEAARKNAAARGAVAVNSRDLHAAFAELHWNEVARLLARGSHTVAPDRAREILQMLEAADEEALQSARPKSLAEIDASVRSRILGQDVAIDRTLPWIKRLRSGIPRDDRPAGVFLLVGPTGTGKTQLAKELARHVFGNEDRLLFLEMSHFQTRESVSGLIGAPPGYVGYGEGILTNGLRDQSERVILFDEIEKADVHVIDIILRFTDEGLISDPAGPIRDGRKSLIVITSNAGQRALRSRWSIDQMIEADPLELAAATLDEAEQELLQLKFRPEFLGRIDEFIPFLPFSASVWRSLMDQMLEREIAKVAKHRRVTLQVEDGVRQALADESYRRSLSEGARAIPRVINERIIIPAIDLLPEPGMDQAFAGRVLAARCQGNQIEWGFA